MLCSALRPSDPPFLHASVREVWHVGEGWKQHHFSHWLPQPIIDFLLQALVPTDPNQPDRPLWSLTASGEFSSASLRKVLASSAPPRSPILWNRVWQFRGPVRASFTLWAGLHRALPTASLLWRRHVLRCPICSWCNRAEHTTLHLLIDCVLSRAVWVLLVELSCRDYFFSFLDVVAWILANIRSRSRLSSPLNVFPYIFRYTVYELWCNHNLGVYHSPKFLENPYALAKRCLRKSLEFLSAWHRESI